MTPHSGLHFTLTVEGLPDTAFVVTKFQGEESLSRPFYFNVSLASRDELLTPAVVLDKNVSLSVWQDGVITQQWQGIAQLFERGDTGLHHSFYRLEMVPALKRSTLRHNSRIFQLQSVPEIISLLLEEMGMTDYAFSTTRVCEQREYCVQYRETDYDFIARLAAEEGLFYYFSHLEGKHTLIFSDDSQTVPILALPGIYNILGGTKADHPYVRTFKRYTESDVSSVQLKDYSFKRPAYSFLHEAMGTDLESQQVVYEHYDYPGRYKSDDSGKAFTQYRIDALRKETITAKGESNLASLMTGHKLTLAEHPQDGCNQDWLIISVQHTGTQPQALEEMGGEGATTYNNQFDAIPGTRQWRPDVSRKPSVDGPQIATVVGPAGEEIYCDEFGRIKVQFSWDRLGMADAFSSCWVRVSQSWAGGQYGMQALPRVGHEVIVSFLEGDPDQPIVTGRTYNANNQTPYPLPEHKSKTVIRTQSHQGEGFNELSFEDQAEQEEIYLHAQKDLNLLVQNDRIETIAHDLKQNIGNDRYQQVGVNDNLTVDGNQTETITGDHSQQTDASLHIKIKDKHIIETGTDLTLKAGTKIVIEAGAELVLSAGGSVVKIDAAGVSLSGAAINLNSGGGAGSGAAYAGQLAEIPKQLDQAGVIDPSMIALEKGTAVAGEANVQDIAFDAVAVEYPVFEYAALDAAPVKNSLASAPVKSALAAVPMKGSVEEVTEEELTKEAVPEEEKDHFRAILLQDQNGEPYANCKCEIDSGAEVIETQTQGDGSLIFDFDLSIKEVDVKFWPEADGDFYHQIHVYLEELAPVEEPKGVQQRLANLGYLDSKIDGSIGILTEANIKALQYVAQLDLSGEADGELLAWFESEDYRV